MAVLKFLAVAVAATFLSENDWAFGATPPNGDGNGNAVKVTNGENGEPPVANGGAPSEPVQDDDADESGGGEADTVTNSAAREDCWKQMNEARNLVGFTGFQQQDMLKITVAEAKTASGTAEEVKQYLTKVCDAVKTPYDDPRNISFISLFNPKDSPKVDCAYFTCPKSAAGGGAQRQTAGTEGAVKALICVTTPNALTKGKKPYEQEQWDKIAAGLKSGSAVAAAPTAVALVAAAVATLLL
ncbi:SAG family member [Eimeria brunetti]|uniref:SAG family member n=1 Tax=Eimeria brunetti TaxID=51314 RepID=U6LS18_9EIME|nr:SAG family member [Eimeria brunetti]